jgi:hypothetical protein
MRILSVSACGLSAVTLLDRNLTAKLDALLQFSKTAGYINRLSVCQSDEVLSTASSLDRLYYLYIDNHRSVQANELPLRQTSLQRRQRFPHHVILPARMNHHVIPCGLDPLDIANVYENHLMASFD